MRRRSAGFVYGGLWGAVGIGLLRQGFHLLEMAPLQIAQQSVLRWLDTLGVLPQESSVLCVACALVLGIIKGRTVMSSAATRYIQSLKAQLEPIPVWRVLPLRMWILMLSMMLLGMLLRWGAPMDLRGICSAAVGTALLIGGLQVVRQSLSLSDESEPSREF
jgi:hypothetical protein